MRSLTIAAAGSISIGLALAGCASPAPTVYAEPPEDAKTARRDVTPAEKKFLMEALSKDLKDPASAQFKWSQIPEPASPGGIVHYCATVNAKNSYGGYVGQKPFIATIGFTNNKMTSASLNIPASKTGKTVFTFAILPRYNDRQLKLYKAKKLGVLDAAVAKDVLAFVATVKTLTAADRALVSAALAAIIAG